MSFASYALFQFIKWVGRLLAIGGVLLLLAGVAGQRPQVLAVGLLCLILGIAVNWYGAFRAKAEQIKRGIK